MQKTFFEGFTMENIAEKPVEVDNKISNISSDGGLILFSKMDKRLRLTERISECIREWREDKKVRHSIQELLKQRILGIISGYEDQNDHNRLRRDGIFQISVGKDGELGSQSMMSRFENGVGVRDVIEISYKMVDLFVEQYGREPEEITIDIDPTDLETYGGQQGTLFHGFYMQYQYYPLLVFCDGICIGAVLRKGTVPASRYAGGVLGRIIGRIREYWPDVRIKVRGDCGFGNPGMYRFCERNGIGYQFGIARNDVLFRDVEDLYGEVEMEYEDKGEKVVRYKSFYYRAGSWDRERVVVAKVEHTGVGMNVRYIVVSSAKDVLTEEEARLEYREYVQRGKMEVDIGEWKNALNSDRMSCSRFIANWFRLLLHTIAYNLMAFVKRMCWGKVDEIAHSSLHTMRIYLIKIGAVVRRLKTRIKVHLSASFPYLNIFSRVVRLIA